MNLFAGWKGFRISQRRIFVENLDMVRPGKGVTLEGIPGYEEILKQGVESFLKPVPKKREVEI